MRSNLNYAKESLSPPLLTMGKCPDSTWQARRFGDVAEFRHLQGFRGVYRGVVPGSQHWGFPKCYCHHACDFVGGHYTAGAQPRGGDS